MRILREKLRILCAALVSVVSFSACVSAQKSAPVFDNHVHIMSPRMIKLFKDVGIPFSKPDADYSDITAIRKRLGTDRFNLISMAYLFGNPEFGKVEDVRKAVEAENDFAAAAKSTDPQNIKAFCGIDPLRDFALEEAKRCFEKLKIDGLKLHFNASQIYLTEPEHLEKVRPIFTFAAENGLPVLLHFDNSHPKFGETDVNLLVDEILLKIKPVKLVLAHFGTSGGFSDKTKKVLSAFIKRLKEEPKLAQHSVLFDISAVALDKDTDGVSKLSDEQFLEVKEYAGKLGFDKIVFGTDYPLYSSAQYLKILKDRVKFSDREIAEILSEKGDVTNEKK